MYRGLNDRLALDIKAGIEQYWHTGFLADLPDKVMVHRINGFAYRLQTGRTIHVRDRRQHVAHFHFHGTYFQHEGAFPDRIKITVLLFHGCRWCEWPVGLAVLDLGVDLVLHVRQRRIRQDTAVTKRPWPDFHAALEPAEDISLRQQAGSLRGDIVVLYGGKFAFTDQLSDFRIGVSGTEIRIIMNVGAGMAMQHMVDIIGGADSGTVVSRGRHDVDIFEPAFTHNPAVHDAVKRDTAGNDEITALRLLPQYRA